ncbi:hypothetical protein A1353_16510 [Methylomonas methanica]|uniref:Glycosyltransferase subfamily 4-like N-terminal domain-containing protein n=1 Tax=Methylomonas methanica TaxID=421 RepID=A0A177M9L5_METMH|nr:glycosyltransferase family 4 protein [Methylomonas methanica]OAI02392.1 hypothetical protein A1353_16510 [Methylomonas methanica]
MKIVIFQPMLKQYRVPLFYLMGLKLADHGHELKVVCGSPPPQERSKGDNVLSSSGYCVVERSHWFFSGKLHVLRNALSYIFWADLIITEQANKHAHNYLLYFLRAIKYKKFGYWGHGQNRQGNPDGLKEKVKRLLLTRCDWWFAYTQGVARYVVNLGYPEMRTTVLNNSIDTSAFKLLLDAQTHEAIHGFKRELLIGQNAKVGLYCGSLYAEKNIEFLLKAAVLIQQNMPDFVLLVVGDGKDRYLVEEFANRHSFIKYLGPLFGEKKALAFRSADLFICPGLVGLAILDAFTAALPMVTCNHSYHSPEIEYLRQNLNGVIAPANLASYAQSIIDVYNNPYLLRSMKNNALDSSNQFSIENMAENFVIGIQGFVDLIEKE